MTPLLWLGVLALPCLVGYYVQRSGMAVEDRGSFGESVKASHQDVRLGLRQESDAQFRSLKEEAEAP